MFFFLLLPKNEFVMVTICRAVVTYWHDCGCGMKVANIWVSDERNSNEKANRNFQQIKTSTKK